jgi:negative regulator of flagellin synthesis FlgM
MRINNFNSIQNNPYKNHAQDMRSGNIQSRFKKDEIQISDEAKNLLLSSKYEQERAEKINDIKNQIDGGTYQVKVTETVSSILNFWRKS